MVAFPSVAILFTWVFIHTKGNLLVAVLFHAWYAVIFLFPGHELRVAEREGRHRRTEDESPGVARG